MAYELTEEEQEFAESLVAEGRFSSIHEAVYSALKNLRGDDDWHEYAEDRIEAGWADLEAGRTIPGDELLARLKTLTTTGK